MIRNSDDFCRELNQGGFSMGGGNAKGIFARIGNNETCVRPNKQKSVLILMDFGYIFLAGEYEK